MDTELLVDDRIDEGRALISELFTDAFDVAVAMWIKTSEEGRWFFYVGSSSVEVQELGNAYRRVYACLSRIPNSSIALSDIKLVNVGHAIARDAIAIRDRNPARIPTRYHGKRLGNLSIEDAYIYPQVSASISREELLRTIVGLMNRRGFLQPSIVTMRNGTTLQAIPKGIDMNVPGSVQIVLHDTVAGIDRVVSVDDVISIQ